VKPDRRTQPFRRGARQPGPPLTAMLRGRTSSGWNPKDIERAAMLVKAGKSRQRPTRPPRVQRPPR